MSHGTRRWAPPLGVALLALAGCSDGEQPLPDPPPTWQGGVSAAFEACAPCHGVGGSAPIGLDPADFSSVAGCRADGTPWVDGPVQAALSDGTHAAAVSASDRALVTQWLATGGMPFASPLAHPAAFAGPATGAGSHATVLREEGYRRLLAPLAEGACLTCHTPAREDGGALPCSTCHGGDPSTDRCGTCHGEGDDPTPTGARCGDDAAMATLHRLHLDEEPGRPYRKVDCSDCHQVPQTLGSPGHVDHADGRADVRFSALASDAARYDPATRTCSDVSCHAGTPTVWAPREDGCDTCHGNPPEGHASDRCPLCHADAYDADENLLAAAHVSGTLELIEACDGCHSAGPEPMLPGGDPGAHALHLSGSALRAPLDCDACHVVPETVDAPGHLDGSPADVVLSPTLAGGGGALEPRWDASTRRCADVGCHGAHLDGGSLVEVEWTRTATHSACDACHALPPSTVRGGAAEHLATGPAECGACHRSDEREPVTTEANTISEAGRGAHIDGCVHLSGGCAP